MCRRPAWYTPVRTRILDKVGQKGADGTAGQRSQSRKQAGAAAAKSAMGQKLTLNASKELVYFVPLTDIADVERARGLLHAVRLNPHRQKY